MRRILFILAVLASQSVFAGPFVSGGMPGAQLCTDSQQTISIKVITLGLTHSASAQVQVNGAAIRAKVICTDTVMANDRTQSPIFECRLDIDGSVIRFFSAGGSLFSGLTQDGRHLSCKTTTL